ncbi:5'-3' exonuclease [Bacillus sp. HMF5848]|uniref:5'-3' exonuclease n=1 Tax=Bacillus sp. HMF5848 TaxID=2495421 RepID=UPI000F78A235|nr:5'-3' exonuclease H3TH domain-containing protein [Bacillus sp. HMF5848]RSK26806.1 5'-3' exonuclease [Bacillus sp. HMF5848]
MTQPRVLLIDGMALLFRAFYATAVSGYYMINSKGIPTNGIHGFTKHLLAAKEQFSPTHIICCWDMGSKTFRTEMFTDYKANRSEPPVELIPQFELVKDVTASFNIPNVGLAGYEADDCIGTLSKQFSETAEVVIITGDKDILQLLQPNISVALLQKGFGNYDTYDADKFIEEKGITPTQFIDLKAMMGDSSDNYPGVKGIGEKTALKLLQQYESIEGILENLSQLTKGQRTKIENDLEMLHLSRKLATISTDVPVSCDLHECLIAFEKEKITSVFSHLELKGFHQYIAN